MSESERPTDPDSLHAMAATLQRIDQRTEASANRVLQAYDLALRALNTAERAVEIAKQSPPNRLAIGYRYAMTLAVLAIVCSACALLVACGVVQVR